MTDSSKAPEGPNTDRPHRTYAVTTNDPTNRPQRTLGVERDVLAGYGIDAEKLRRGQIEDQRAEIAEKLRRGEISQATAEAAVILVDYAVAVANKSAEDAARRRKRKAQAGDRPALPGEHCECCGRKAVTR